MSQCHGGVGCMQTPIPTILACVVYISEGRNTTLINDLEVWDWLACHRSVS